MIGLLYIITGLLVEFTFITLAGSMLGMTTPIFTITGLIVAPLFSIGPSLLFLSGVGTIFPNRPRWSISLIAGTVLVAALALWTVPKVGWQNAVWLVLEPPAVSLPIAYLIQFILKKRWISALVGSGLSAPYCVLGSVYLLYHHVFDAAPFAATELWLFFPGAIVMASFVSSLYFRKS